jgi:hypothetical protein
MKGFPPGPAPMNQLEAAPVRDAERQSVSLDPFAGMDLPQISEEAGGGESAPVVEQEREAEDFSAKEPAQQVAPPSVQQVAPAPSKVEQAPEPEPTPRPQAQPQPQAEAPAKKKSFVPVRPSAGKPVTSEIKQLELRAIFGVDHELNYKEIMQKARGLSGIVHVAKVNGKESAAIEALQGLASKLGLDEDEPIVLSCPEGFIDFICCDETSLAVLRNDDYAPGVRETLIIVARELEKL